MDTRKLKEKATEAFAKGKFGKAAELYEAYCLGDPKDLQARLRMGDAWAKAGVKGSPQKAIDAYRSAAEGFAKEGFLPRAIAAAKLILELDPAHQGVQQMLASLYSQKGPRRSTVEMRAAAKHAPIELPPDDPAEAQNGLELPPEPEPSPAPSASKVFELSDADDGGVELDLGGPAAVAKAPSGLPAELDLDLVSKEADLEEVEVEATVEAELEVVPASPPPPAASAPPGMRRRSTAEIPAAAAPSAPDAIADAIEATFEEPTAEAARPASRIWIPGSAAAPEPVRADPARPGYSTTPPAKPAPGARELERTLETFSNFGDFEADLPKAAAPPPSPPPPQEAAPAERIPTFTELELDGDSLLHAVEMAAVAGLNQRGQAVAAAPEESMAGTAEEPQGDSGAVSGGLPKIPLFSDLPADAFIELFERCPLKRFAMGERIFEQGSLGDAFYVICGGSVKVSREDGGTSRELATLPEGAFFGEMALLSGAARTASVDSASEETQLLEISAPVLAQLSHRYPQVAQALKKFCRQRLLANLMNTSAMFQPFEKKDRKALVERFRARDLNKGDAIIREGAETDGLYVVLSGEVEVTKGGKFLAHLKEGDVFGEISLLHKTPATATVCAAKRTSLLRLPRKDFDQVVLTHPQVLALIADLSEDRRNRTDAVLSGVAEMGDEGLMLV